MTLIQKIKDGRKFSVSVEGKTFSGEVLRYDKLIQLSQSGTDADICAACITGWDGVTEADLLPGGGDKAVSFDKELFAEIIGDRADWWHPIITEILRIGRKRREAQEAAEKN